MMNTNDGKMVRFGIALAILIARCVRERSGQSSTEADIAFEKADAFIGAAKANDAYPTKETKRP